MKRWEIITAVVIVLIALGGSILYLRARSAARESKIKSLSPEDRKLLEEAPECDSYRLELARLRAELRATPDFDPLRRSNISGAIQLKEAELAECERSARRARLLA